jgi:DNA-directed RNA polymerase specialized sigma24 family protein
VVAKAFDNPIVKVDIVTGRVLVCRIQELWLQEEVTIMTEAEYNWWLKRMLAQQRRELEEQQKTLEKIQAGPVVTLLAKAKSAKRSRSSPLPPELLHYLLEELEKESDPRELAKKAGVCLSTVYRIARERTKYQKYLEVYNLHEEGLGIVEISAKTGLTTGTVKNLVHKLWKEDELVS